MRPTTLAGTLPVTVTVRWFVAAWVGASSTGEAGMGARVGVGEGDAGMTAPAIPETAPPTVETILGRAPITVSRTTAPSATTEMPRATFTATGRLRGASEPRGGGMRGTAGRRGTGAAGRGRPEEGGRGRTWLGRPRRGIIAWHCRTLGSRDWRRRPARRCSGGERSGVRWRAMNVCGSVRFGA